MGLKEWRGKPKRATVPKSRAKISDQESSQVIIFRGKRYWWNGDSYTLGGAKKKARKVLAAGYRVKIVINDKSNMWGLYIHPNPYVPYTLL